LITRLKRCAYAQIVTIVVLALWAVLAASPAAANAKATSLAKDPQSTDQNTVGVGQSVVVAPGDSLWSISARWLGPEATTQQIADGVERIYALNEQQIGSSPDLILAGQRLSLPSEAERQSPEPEEAASARHAGESTAPNPRSRTASNRSDTVAEAVVGIADRRARQARGEARSEPASLPVPARPAPVSEVRTLARNDSPPSLALFVVSDARSIFSALATTAVEPSSPGSYPGRKVLGGALLAMSCVLALILAVRVAREVWGPSYTRRQARRRWVRETLARSYASDGTFDARVAFAAVEGGHPSQHSPRPAPTQTAAAGDPRTRDAPSGHRVNGSALLDTVQNISRRRQLRIRKTRPLKAKRPARGHAKGAPGAARLSRARRGHATRVQRARALSRKGRRIVGSEHRDPHPVQEWKIGEPLRSAMNAILVQPGAPLRDVLLGVKPLVADELTTVASLEQLRALSYNEQRQARALRQFLATIEKVSDDARVG
jgi:LysM repeat protein